MGQQAAALKDLLRNGELALAGDVDGPLNPWQETYLAEWRPGGGQSAHQVVSSEDEQRFRRSIQPWSY
jgi:hypothetical protein